MRTRLERELSQVEAELRRIENKLRNVKGDYFFEARGRVHRANDLVYEAKRILINGRLRPNAY